MRYLLLFAIASCNSIPTSVELSLVKTMSDEPSAVNIRTYNRFKAKEFNGNENNRFTLPATASIGIVGTIVIYASDADVELRIDAQGFDESLASPISQGVTRVKIKPGTQTQTTIILQPGILTDLDHDGVPDDIDDCPNTFNPNQEDLNGDGTGDACSSPLSDASTTPPPDGPPDTQTDKPPAEDDVTPDLHTDAGNIDTQIDVQTDTPPPNQTDAMEDGTDRADTNALETNKLPGTGGSVGTGGSSGMGGNVGTGGTTSAGGASMIGGTTGAGGASMKGGAIGSGGTSSTGGTVSTGGASMTGGTVGTGGTSGTAYGIVGQSCTHGLTCSTVSCCAQSSIPSGTFSMGTDTDLNRNPNESPSHPTTLDSYIMDKFEVTVGRFRSFYQAYNGTLPPVGSGAHPAHADSGWQAEFAANMPTTQNQLQSQINCNVGQYQTWTTSAGTHENMPMNCVSWYVAFAFCIWDGGRLPTEAEWEMAASGGSEKNEYPWGVNDPDPATNAIMNCLGDGISGCSPTDILPVSSRPVGANRWGNEDLAGSVWEFTLDYYDVGYYASLGTCNNCINLTNSSPGWRVIRGGDFSSSANMIRSTERASYQPITVSPYVGFRCARSH
jgi:sulfatase modifying factor 1